MEVRIETSWKDKLNTEFEQPYFANLVQFVKQEYATKTIFPPAGKIFNAFDHCSFDKVKVVILGQDPYHGEGQANGLCFSVSDGIKQPPSLVNIFKEIEADLGIPRPASGNLERWADQGVLLLNATLTVEAHKAGSHQNKGWEQFTDAVIEKVANEKEGVVFFLWGSYAQKKGRVIDPKKHLILKSVHPSPLSAHRGFFGNQQFQQANNYLEQQGKTPINW
ncbi:uracil-DNA glycosylase [Flammeovirga sp. EKP202]|uniref:uracil-DNA glycosylase n=1 Tax=Flammeovirga sp. EKP202 TaxID=2770592 RepID=UPI00165F0028|nr:uracil-DNA glycosylase [Flammeovirga sp. EKP202]MBD0400505.1 uracil-DNA glycosylase [Flammeovirga sp. EKP202]